MLVERERPGWLIEIAYALILLNKIKTFLHSKGQLVDL